MHISYLGPQVPYFAVGNRIVEHNEKLIGNFVVWVSCTYSFVNILFLERLSHYFVPKKTFFDDIAISDNLTTFGMLLQLEDADHKPIIQLQNNYGG